MTQPPSPRARFGIRFSLLARRWRRALEAGLAASGMTDATWAPLVHLKETGGGITQKDLAARVGVEGSSLVRVLDILEREGVVERRRDSGDGRARLIHLTQAGGQRVAAIRATLIQAEERMLCDLQDEDLANMLRGLEVISHRMDALERQAAAATGPAPDAQGHPDNIPATRSEPDLSATVATSVTATLTPRAAASVTPSAAASAATGAETGRRAGR